MKRIKCNSMYIFLLYALLVIIAKTIRYTIMKSVLVDTSSGWGILDIIKSGNYGFAYLGGEYDSNSISAINCAFFFSPLYKMGIETYIGFEIAITIIWNAALIIVLNKMDRIISLGQFVFLCLFIISLNIFDFNLAKEPIQMILFLGLFFIVSRKSLSIKTEYALSILLILLFVVVYRLYYFLIIIYGGFVFLYTSIIFRKKKSFSLSYIVAFVIVVTIFYYLILLVANRYSPSSFQELVRVRSRTGDAATQIMPLIKSDNLLVFSINYSICLVRMMLPIELCFSGLKYIPYVVMQLIITYHIVGKVRRFNTLTDSQRLSTYIILGFVFASCAFEPDFGSWIRHECVMLPLFIVISLSHKTESNDRSVSPTLVID